MISENCCNFIVFKYKEIQTIIAMITEDKITELFCMADGFCKFSDAMMEKYTLKSNKKAALPPWFHHVKSWNHANHDTVSWFRLPLPEAFLSGKGMQTSASPLPESCLIQPFRGTWKGSCHTFGSVHQEGIAWEMYRHKFRGQHTLRGGVKFGSPSSPVGCRSVDWGNCLLAVPSVLAQCAQPRKRGIWCLGKYKWNASEIEDEMLRKLRMALCNPLWMTIFVRW